MKEKEYEDFEFQNQMLVTCYLDFCGELGLLRRTKRHIAGLLSFKCI